MQRRSAALLPAAQRAERWGAMIGDQLVDPERWTMVRAGHGCPAYGR
jgi:hypothetical protein